MTAISQNTKRISSIDIARGLIMVIMALDHTREFWGPTPFRPEDVAQTNVPLFFTRWFTHLCAPAFIFLSGASIYLFESQKQDKSRASVFVFTRGAWLIVVEIALMSFILTHSYDLIVLSILWVIGWCMMLMAAVIWLPRSAIIIISAVMIATHDLWPPINPASPGQILLATIHNTPFLIPERGILVTYTIIPWLGVMMAGYGLAKWFTIESSDRMFRILGATLILVFVIVRLLNSYGEPVSFNSQERGGLFTFLSFINVTKYPPSLLFLCVTLGIFFLLITFLNKNSAVSKFLLVYGKVPFFFFVIHFALLSVASYFWTRISFGNGINLAFTPFDQLPESYEPGLARVYFVWIIVVAVTYFPCRWFGAFKARHRYWWLSYL